MYGSKSCVKQRIQEQKIKKLGPWASTTLENLASEDKDMEKYQKKLKSIEKYRKVLKSFEKYWNVLQSFEKFWDASKYLKSIEKY